MLQFPMSWSDGSTRSRCPGMVLPERVFGDKTWGQNSWLHEKCRGSFVSSFPFEIFLNRKYDERWSPSDSLLLLRDFRPSKLQIAPFAPARPLYSYGPPIKHWLESSIFRKARGSYLPIVGVWHGGWSWTMSGISWVGPWERIRNKNTGQ